MSQEEALLAVSGPSAACAIAAVASTQALSGPFPLEDPAHSDGSPRKVLRVDTAELRKLTEAVDKLATPLKEMLAAMSTLATTSSATQQLLRNQLATAPPAASTPVIPQVAPVAPASPPLGAQEVATGVQEGLRAQERERDAKRKADQSIVKKWTDEQRKEIDKIARDYDRDVAKLASKRKRKERMETNKKFFIDEAANHKGEFPAGMKPIKVSESQTEYDGVYSLAARQECKLMITIPKGSSIREAIESSYWQLCTFRSEMELEAASTCLHSAETAASKVKLEERITDYATKAQEVHGRALGLEPTAVKPYCNDFLKAEAERVYESVVKKAEAALHAAEEKKKEEQKKKDETERALLAKKPPQLLKNFVTGVVAGAMEAKEKGMEVDTNAAMDKEAEELAKALAQPAQPPPPPSLPTASGDGNGTSKKSRKRKKKEKGDKGGKGSGNGGKPPAAPKTSAAGAGKGVPPKNGASPGDAPGQNGERPPPWWKSKTFAKPRKGKGKGKKGGKRGRKGEGK